MFCMQNITGYKIRQTRKDKGITQAELAARLQILGFAHTRNTIAKIETGIRQVTDIELKALSDVLNVPITHFFEDDDASSSDALT